MSASEAMRQATALSNLGKAAKEYETTVRLYPDGVDEAVMRPVRLREAEQKLYACAREYGKIMLEWER